MEEYKKAYSYALLLLSRRDYSVKSLLEKVKKKFPNLSDEEAYLLKEKLEEIGVLNEKRAIQSYFFSKMEKGWGRRKIAFHLRNLGFPEEKIKAVLEGEEFDYSFIIRELKKRYNFRSQKDWEKVKRFLLQRGFDYSEISDILNRLK